MLAAFDNQRAMIARFSAEAYRCMRSGTAVVHPRLPFPGRPVGNRLPRRPRRRRNRANRRRGHGVRSVGESVVVDVERSYDLNETAKHDSQYRNVDVTHLSKNQQQAPDRSALGDPERTRSGGWRPVAGASSRRGHCAGASTRKRRRPTPWTPSRGLGR